jgi:hypothetical protein
MKQESREDGRHFIIFEPGDSETVRGLKTCLADSLCRFKFSPSFTRWFYTKPATRLDLPLKVKPSLRAVLVGMWFDTLLKMYVALYPFGYRKSDLKQFVQKFSQENDPPRWRLVQPFWAIPDGRPDADVKQILRALELFPEYCRRQTRSVEPDLDIAELFEAESLQDLISLIDLIEESSWKFEQLYLAHQHIGGLCLDLVLDEALIEIKTVPSCALQMNYFDN